LNNVGADRRALIFKAARRAPAAGRASNSALPAILRGFANNAAQPAAQQTQLPMAT